MIEIYLDTANLDEIIQYNDSLISGITTNPSLAKQAGVNNYTAFAQKILEYSKGKPLSLEVLSDDWGEMEKQAKKLSSLAPNVFVKVPVRNIDGNYLCDQINFFENMNLNITAITTYDQIKHLTEEFCFNPERKYILSVFAGRVADCGHDPEHIMRSAKKLLRYHNLTNVKLLWASPREVFNIYQADRSGADIITCTPALIQKFLKLRGKDLEEYSIETAQQFYNDGKNAGLSL